MLSFRACYRRLLPYEWRFYLYKLRNKKNFKHLRERVYESDKGNFSLRGYDKTKSIFIHITKSAGTSLAKTIYEELPYHYTAQQYRVIFGAENFNDYYKYAFVRNPWDRLYSAFSFLKDGGWNQDDALWSRENLSHIDSFDTFVMEWFGKDKLNSHIHFWPQSKFLCDRHGCPLINEIFYFENINSDFQTVCERLSTTCDLTHTNRSKRNSYKNVYTRESIDKVSQVYSQDIKNFGYTFDTYQRKEVRNAEFIDAAY
jgi:hypothetical protein